MVPRLVRAGGRTDKGARGRRGVRVPRPAVLAAVLCGLKPRRQMDKSCASTGVHLGQPRSAIGREPAELGSAQRALARDLSPDRRELSGDRRAGRLAQSVAHPADDAVAGVGAQRHVRSGTARPRLCAAYLGRAAADRVRAAFLRRRPDADRRSDRARSQGDRGAGRRLGSGQVGRVGADRSVRASLRAQPRRRRRADREIEPAIEAHRVRPARARARTRGSRRRGRPGRKSRSQYPGRPADVGADRGRQFPQRPHPRPHSARGQGRDRAAARGGPGRARCAHSEDRRRRPRQLVGRRNATSAS